MNWFEEVPLPSYPNRIQAQDELVLLGSCFSTHMGQRLSDAAFQTFSNPFGVLFHPLALFDHIIYALEQRPFSEEGLIKQDDMVKHFDAHGSWYDRDPTRLMLRMNEQRNELRKHLLTARHLVFTFGTAWVYRHTGLKQMVANCHKQPAHVFTKKLLAVEDMVAKGKQALKLLHGVNPDCMVTFTVSPVKHTKDGLSQNHISKGRCIDSALQLANRERCIYFPAFELVTDQLRDYRFFSADRAHPSTEAIEFVWNRWVEVACSDQAREKIDAVMAFRKGLHHRSLNPTSTQHKKHLMHLLKKAEALEKQWNIQLKHEKELINKQLENP